MQMLCSASHFLNTQGMDKLNYSFLMMVEQCYWYHPLEFKDFVR